MTDVTVIPVNGNYEFPRSEGRIQFGTGIYSEARAKAWGEKIGASTVYWWKRAGRVYAIGEMLPKSEHGGVAS